MHRFVLKKGKKEGKNERTDVNEWGLVNTWSSPVYNECRLNDNAMTYNQVWLNYKRTFHLFPPFQVISSSAVKLKRGPDDRDKGPLFYSGDFGIINQFVAFFPAAAAATYANPPQGKCVKSGKSNDLHLVRQLQSTAISGCITKWAVWERGSRGWLNPVWKINSFLPKI